MILKDIIKIRKYIKQLFKYLFKFIKYYMNDNYLYHNLITYFGNKRKLLSFINNEILLIKKKLEKETVTMMDGFSGTGIVSRLLKYHSSELYTNDIEDYSYLLNTCYLSDPTKYEIKMIHKYIDECNELEHNLEGIITNYYSPKDTNNIQEDDRVFYTRENGMVIDTIRDRVETIPKKYQKYILSQLIIKSSIHVNTAGHFRSFYKNKNTKRGVFGGTNQIDSKRISGKIKLNYPEFSDQEHKCNVHIYKEDINDLILKLPEIDIVYYDPPYNDTPYGSNYHLLNTILNNELGKNISKISGIPEDWKRSNYNKRRIMYETFYHLLKKTKSKYIILSNNSDGHLPEKDLLKIFNELQYKYEKKEMNYVVYKACKNRSKRNKDLKEILFILHK